MLNNAIVHQASIEFGSNEDNLDAKIKKLMISKCTCSCFINVDNKKIDDLLICGCGRPLYLHENDVIELYETKKNDSNYPSKWNKETHTRGNLVTDAYGELIFNNSKRQTSLYLRIDFRAEIKDVAEIMFDNWKLHKPKLLISVTGGAKNFKMKLNLKNAFKKAVIKAAIDTDAWLVTGGTEEGIMKIIGEAYKENTIRLGQNKKLVLLGIANWTTIRNNHFLTKTQNQNNKKSEYSKIDDKNFEESPYVVKELGTFLDPNHTHFILVDGCQLNKYGSEIKFRTKLENHISDNLTENLPANYAASGNKVPIIVLVIGGGQNTFATCLESVQAGHPCLFIEAQGSEGCSNIFAYALRRVKEKINKQDDHEITEDLLDINLKEELFKMAQKIWGKKSEVDIRKMVDNIDNTIKKKYLNLLSVFSIETTYKTNELDEAILYSLLKAQNSLLKNQKFLNEENEEKSLLISQLKLALTWDRIDVAKKFIFNDDLMWDTNFLKETMYIAIKIDRPDFVKAFLEHGIILSKFLTYRCLLKLYNDIPKNSTLYDLFIRKKFGKFKKRDNSEILINFKDIGKIIQDLLDNFYIHEYLKKPFDRLEYKDIKKILSQTDEFGSPLPGIETNILFFNHQEIDVDDLCPNPEHHLFIYSVLTKKPKLAKLFIRQGKNELIACLIASKIFKSYAIKQDDESLSYNNLALEFEDIAVKTIDLCYQSKPNNAKLLLMRTIPEYGNSTCLQIAKLASDLNFLRHPCVQELLATIWHGKILQETKLYNIVICLILPFLAPFLCSFNDKNNEGKDEIQINKNTEIEELEHEKLVINRIDINDNTKKLNYWLKMYEFLRAPFIKFLYEKILYLIFLLIFSYVILCDFYPITEGYKSLTNLTIQISTLEVILIIWIYSILIENLHQWYVIETKIVWTKIKFFFSNIWNLFCTFAIFLFTAGMILRFIPIENCYRASRIVLSLDIILWFFNFMHTYTSIKTMGPKLIMIKKMFVELLSYILIVLAFIFGFGISTNSLNYHNAPINLDLLKNIFFPSFFIIPQEYYTRDSILYANTCEVKITSRNATFEYSLDDCPDKYGSQVSLAIYTIYAVFINILMVNLLIAIFSNTYSEVEEESDKLWRYQRYYLIYEYFHKPILPPPFTVLYPIGYIFKIIAPILRKSVFKQLKQNNNIFNMIFFKFCFRYRNGFSKLFKIVIKPFNC